MSLKVNSSGSTWVDAKNVEVNTSGSTWAQAKSVKVWNGSAWVYSWVPPTTVAVSVPYSWVLSSLSGQNPASASPSVIQPRVFTVTLSRPSSVLRASFQLSYAGGAWTEYAAWDNPTQGTLTHSMSFQTSGAWSFRVVVTQLDGAVVTSAVGAITCYKKSLSIGASNTAPEPGTTVTFSFACHDDCAPGQSGQGLWYQTGGGGWTYYKDPGVDATWYIGGDYAVHNWLYQETFPDGSILNSNSVAVDPVAVVLTEWLVSGGGSGATVQQGLYEGWNRGLPVRFVGSFDSGGPVQIRIPGGARVTATEATFTRMQFFNHNSTSYGAVGDGEYRRAGNIIWNGGSFDCFDVVSTAFSISHCPSFELHNATIWNYKAAGHGIEINSSGGFPVAGGVTNLAESQFAVKVVGCVFNGVISRRAEDYDEAVHIDYAWIGDIQATAAGVVNDGTVCNNVLVKGCTFQKGASSTYSPPVGFGTHHSVSDTSLGRHLPNAQHANLKVQGNTFSGVVPADIAGNERAAVHIRNSMKQVWIVGNAFYSCAAAVSLGLVDLATAGFPAADGVWITGNHFQSCVAANQRWVDTNSPDTASNDKWSGVHIDDNTFTGGIPASQSTYLIGCSNVNGLSVQANRFWGLSHSGSLATQTGNRIHGTPGAPAAGTTNMTLENNTWSASSNGAGAVVSNS